MVVTRRVPVPPAPPASRSSSTQSTPRISRNRAPPAPQPDDTEALYSKTLPGKENVAPLASKYARSVNAKKKRQSRSCFPSFSFLILTLFSLYALSTLHPSPVESFRHALSIPHKHLIKPYVVPSLRAALSHPILEPHVTNLRAAVHPYAEGIENGARPVLAKFSQVEMEHVRPLVRRGTKVSYSFIRKTWQRTVIPSYNSYLRPHIQPHLDRWNFFYYSKIDPRLRATVDECMLRYYKIKPHVDSARRAVWHYSVIAYSEIAPRAHRFYKGVQPHIIALWNEAQPHIISGLKFLRLQSVKGASALRTYVAMAAVRLGDARRKFVDPHVKRIWEKVESRSPATSVKTTSFPASAKVTPATSSALTTDEHTSKTTFDASSVSETLAATPLPESSEPIVESYVGATRASTNDEVSRVAPSTIAETVGLGVAAEMVIDDDMKQSTAMDLPVLPVTLQAEFSVSEDPEAKSTTSQEISAPTQSPVTSEAEENIDDFLLQLGIVSDEPSGDQQSDTAEEDHRHALFMKQEAEAAHRAKTAAKRADIVKRHKDWQEQLDNLFIARERDLRTVLVNIRKRAVEELKSLSVHYGQEKKSAKVVDSIEQAAGQLVKGIEAYLKKDRERKAQLGYEWSEEVDDRKGQWGKVMDKVNERYEETVSNTLDQVQGWYVGVRETEVNEGVKAFSELKSLAEAAQMDLGLDYAWLDDVTYQDWQNYHDLLRTAERFQSVAETIQNGTHAHPPVDPLVPALNALHEELQEVIFGVRTQLSMLRSEGNDLYARSEPETTTTPTRDDEPTMSILPISGDSQDATMVDISDVILGKGEEQIKQALNAAGFDVNEAQADNHVEL